MEHSRGPQLTRWEQPVRSASAPTGPIRDRRRPNGTLGEISIRWTTLRHSPVATSLLGDPGLSVWVTPNYMGEKCGLAHRQPPCPTAWTCCSLVEHPPPRLNVRRAADYQKVRPAVPARSRPARHPRPLSGTSPIDQPARCSRSMIATVLSRSSAGELSARGMTPSASPALPSLGAPVAFPGGLAQVPGELTPRTVDRLNNRHGGAGRAHRWWLSPWS